MSLQDDILKLSNIPVNPLPMGLTLEAWLSLLPVEQLRQLEPEKRNEFLLDALRRFDAAGVEIAGSAADGIVAMEGWR